MKYNIIDTPLTLATIAGIAALEGYMRQRVSGGCMEAVAVCDGDIIVTDLTRRPIPNPQGERRDVVLIWDEENQRTAVKGYIGAWNNMQWVGTQYTNVGWDGDKFRMNQAFPVSRILGVVRACYTPDMTLKWERDLFDCPSELSWEPVISDLNKGGHITMKN